MNIKIITKIIWVLFFTIGLFMTKNTYSQYCTTPTSTTAITPTAVSQNTAIFSTGARAFTFTATVGCVYTFATCGLSTADTYLRLYSGVGGTLLVTADDNCGVQSSFTWTATSTGTFSVLLTNYSCAALTNNTQMSYIQNSCPAGYNPCSPVAGNLSCNTNVTATFASGSGAGWSPNTCGFSTPGQEKIYTFTPTTTGLHNIVQASSSGYVDYFWKPVSAGCSNAGWICFDDLFGASTSATPATLTAGVQYYILADPEFSTGGTSVFQITCPSAVPPCTYTVPFSGNNTITANSGTICEHAGTGNYSNGANGYTVINPAAACQLVRLTFASFSVETCCDYITVYNGVGTGGTVLYGGPGTGGTFPPVITSTSGPLTILFYSDGSVVSTGFSATISNVAAPAPTLGTVSNAGPINFCDASGNFITPITVSGQTGTITWDWGSNNGVWNNNWLTGNSSGVCCFPKKTSNSDGNADRIRYRVNNAGCTEVTSGTILIVNRYNEAPTGMSASSPSYCASASPGTITLTANFPSNINMNGTVRFYSGSCGGTLVGSVAPAALSSTASLSITAPATTTTYFARYEPGTGTGCSNTACVQTTVTVTSIPNDNCVNAITIPSLPYTSAVIDNACATDDFTTSVCDGPYKNVWWKVTGICGTMTAITCTGGTNFDNEIAVFTGSCGSFTEIACNDDNGAGCTSNYAGVSWTATAGTDYYISVGSYYSAGVTGNLQLNVTATPFTASVAPTGATGTTTICTGSSTTLTVAGGTMGTGATTQWFTGSCGGTSAGTGNSITVSPTSNTTYYVRYSGTCNTTTCATVTVTVNPLPQVSAFASASGVTSICTGSQGQLVVTTSSGTGPFTVVYNDGTSNQTATGVASGTPFNAVPNPTTGTTNYTLVSVTDANGCVRTTGFTDGTASISVRQLPTATISGTTTVCQNAASPNITFTGTAPGGTIPPYTFTYNINGGANQTVTTVSGSSVTVSVPTTATGTFTYNLVSVAFASNPACTNPASGSATVTVNPNHAIALTSAGTTTNQTVCNGVAITNITYAVSGGATGAGVTGLPSGVSGTFSGGTLTISGTPTVDGTFNYTVTTTGNSCPAVTATGTIIVNSLIDYANLQFPGSASVCQGGSLTAYGQVFEPGVTPAAGQGAGLVAQIGYSTSNTNPNTWTNWSAATFNVQSGNNDEFAGTLTGLAPGTYYYTFRYSLNGCPYQYGGFPNGFWNGTTQTSGVLTVNPNHTITLTSAGATTTQTLCQNTAITNITYTLGGGATGATVTGLPSGVTANVAGGVLTISGTPTVSGPFSYSITTTGNACTVATASGTITVNPNHTLSLSSGSNTQTICSGSSIGNIVYAVGGGGTGAGVTGLPTGLSGNFSGGNFTISGTPTQTGTFSYTVTTTGNGCTVATATGSITINPLHTLTLSSGSTTQTVCQNVAIGNIVYTVGGGATGAGVTGLPPGVSGNFSGGTLTISGTPTAGGTFTYTVTTTGNSCPAATATGTITVNSLLDWVNLQFPASATICPSGSLTAYGRLYEPGVTPPAGAPSGVVVQIGYSTTNTNPNTWTNWSAATYNAQFGNDDEYAGTISGLSSGTYYYTFRYSLNGCAYQYGGYSGPGGGIWDGTTYVSGVLTVSPNHTISLTSAGATTTQTLCQNVAITDITYALGGGATGATVTGLPSGVTANVAGGVLTISGAPTASGSFSYSITTTGNACTVATATGTITVNPVHTLSLSSGSNAQTICSGSSIGNIVYAVGGGGTGAGVTGLPTGLSGNFSGGNFTIIGIPTQTGTFNYTVTTTGNGCTVATATGSITINPLHTLTLSSGSTTQTVCQNVAIGNIVYTVGGGATGAGVTGLPPGVSGNFSGGTLTISGTPTSGGTFTYTVTTTGNSCPAATATGTITVNSLLDWVNLQFPASATICPSGSLTAYGRVYEPGVTPPAGAPSGVVVQIGYSTTNTNPNTWTNWIAATYNSQFGNDDEYAGTISGLSSGTYYYTFRYSLNGCTYQYGGYSGPGGGIWDGTTYVSGVLTVNPNHTLSLTSAGATTTQTLCQNVAITDITYALGGGATGATVTGLPSGVTANVAGGVLTISGTPTASGPFSYSITTTGNACTVATASGTITVDPNHTLSLTSAGATTTQTLCQNVAITDITYALGGGATGATVTGLPSGVTANVAGGVLTISGTPTASGLFSYSITTTGNVCTVATASGTITVNPVHTLSLTSAGTTTTQTLCQNVAITDITYALGGGATGATVTGLPSGVTANVASGVLTISGVPTVSGPFSYSITTTGNACTVATASGTITVNPVHTLSLTSAGATTTQTLCQNVAITDITYALGGGATGATVTGLPSGVTANVAGGVLTISGTPTASGPFSYSITTTGNACTVATASGTITVNPNHTLSLSSGSNTQTLCSGSSIGNIVYAVGGGGTGAGVTGLPTGLSGNFSSGNFTISGTPTQTGTFNYTVTTTGNGCTVATATGSITIVPGLVLTPGGTNVSCNGGNNGTASVTATGGTGTYTYSWWINGSTGSSISGLTVGSYTVTVTSGPCSATSSYTVTEPPVLLASTCIKHDICQLNQGEISVQVAGGTSPYTIAWTPSGGSPASPITTSNAQTIITGLTGGVTYTITVTDFNGCNP